MNKQTSELGILAYGSLIDDPGNEIENSLIRVIPKVKTPFAVEFARSSYTRGGAPTLVPVDNSGSQVCGSILVIDASPQLGADMLWRRETRQENSDKTYNPPPAEEKQRVRIEQLKNFMAVATVLYTSIGANIIPLTAGRLAELAIASVAKAERNKDGVSYLIYAKSNGIRTALSIEFENEILRRTSTDSLTDALKFLRCNG